MTAQELSNLIRAGLPGAEVDALGDPGGDHFQAIVVSPTFAGKGLVERHQMVYAALGDIMRERVHALSLKTYTPDEVG